MQRDIDLIRDILLEIEALTYTGMPQEIPILPGSSADEMSYHLALLTDRSLIKAHEYRDSNDVALMPIRLTSDGHDFLKATQDERFWSKAKEYVKKTTGTLTLDGLKIAIPFLTRELIEGRIKL